MTRPRLQSNTALRVNIEHSSLPPPIFNTIAALSSLLLPPIQTPPHVGLRVVFIVDTPPPSYKTKAREEEDGSEEAKKKNVEYLLLLLLVVAAV
jgi:hypothetical protein